jgi:hypothetical protein
VGTVYVISALYLNGRITLANISPLIKPATSSNSHFGVDVAPQTPMLSPSWNHEKSISSILSILYDLGFTDLHELKRIAPLELSLPETKIITECFAENSLK